MKRGTWFLGGLSLAIVSLALLLPWLAAAADAPAPKKDAAKAAPARRDSAKQDSPPQKAGEKEPARVRYARAYLALAKLDVQIANDRNKQVAETLPPGIMIVLERRVALAEQWLKEAQGDGKSDDITVRIGEIYLRTAEANLAQGERVNQISPLRPRALERLRLKVDLAQSALATAKALDPSSPEAVLQFNIDRLREEVSEMHIRQIELLDRN